MNQQQQPQYAQPGAPPPGSFAPPTGPPPGAAYAEPMAPPPSAGGYMPADYKPPMDAGVDKNGPPGYGSYPPQQQQPYGQAPMQQQQPQVIYVQQAPQQQSSGVTDALCCFVPLPE
ncbi:hypothetical protein HDU77_000193 [Chytriomyces hyalinus]|nr:hypothetical protein HDU77_000193 [Chytriomyces hyalinus]